MNQDFTIFRKWYAKCHNCGQEDQIDQMPRQAVQAELRRRGWVKVRSGVRVFQLCPECKDVQPNIRR